MIKRKKNQKMMSSKFKMNIYLMQKSFSGVTRISPRPIPSKERRAVLKPILSETWRMSAGTIMCQSSRVWKRTKSKQKIFQE